MYNKLLSVFLQVLFLISSNEDTEVTYFPKISVRLPDNGFIACQPIFDNNIGNVLFGGEFVFLYPLLCSVPSESIWFLIKSYFSPCKFKKFFISLYSELSWI